MLHTRLSPDQVKSVEEWRNTQDLIVRALLIAIIKTKTFITDR